MKRLLFLAMALCCFGLMTAQPIIKFEKHLHDFGKFHEKKVQQCEFVFTNVGDKPLVVKQAFGSCGCIVARSGQEKVEPGKRGVIRVSYNGRGKFEGRFKSAITVRSNASNALTRLYIQGDMQVDD